LREREERLADVIINSRLLRWSDSSITGIDLSLYVPGKVCSTPKN